VNDAFNSLESRVRSLESFFNLVIQIQSQSGIVFPQLFARPEF
jgi:Flp pilus assembly protein TadB